jgi:phage host-nuclease inhibitor protein Gam
MATRTKPQPLIISDLAQADEALRQLGEIARESAQIESGMNAQIDQVKAVAKAQMEPLTASRKRLEDALAVFGTQKKAELFPARKRSQELTFGLIGFRRATSLRLMAKRTWGSVLERLEALGFTSAIRTKREVDKPAMADWSDEQLETVGVKRETSDEFYIELKQEALADKAS